MNQNLVALGNGFVDRCRHEPFLTMSEGLTKVRCLETALSLGWTLQEGAGESPSGPVADYFSMKGGIITCRRDRRVLALPEGSADLAVVEPLQLLVEIKTRPDHGTKSQAQFQAMDADVERVSLHRNAAFFFLFDPRIYLSFSGEKVETRGRPAVAAAWFSSAFPGESAFTSGAFPLCLKVARGGTAMDLLVWRFSAPFPGDRTLIVGARGDATF